MITAHRAYLAGILAGDGYLGYRKHKHEYSINCGGNPKNEKEFYSDIIAPLVRKEFGIEVHPKHLSGGTFGFVIYSKKIFEYFTKHIGLPISPKHPKLRIPESILINDKYTAAFIKGVFDTDGCISFKKRYKKYPYYPVLSISSKTSEFAAQINDFLLKKGFNTWVDLDRKILDYNNKSGYSIRSTITLYGKKNLEKWLCIIGISNPKHLKKIALVRKRAKLYSGGQI